MKRSELLSPAGSWDSAIAAIQNGCDAIYLAGNKFGARSYASNFDDVQLKEIVQYAHAYGVKVYVTLNTLIHDDELQDCFDKIKYYYNSNVDALIMQDLGMVFYVRSQYPDFEVHASTQMHVTNKYALSFLKNIGIHRAVLAREIHAKEIPYLTQCGVDLEVFVHGALCVSYSGQCLFSYMVGGRSGNRGECAQSCRMPYSLVSYDDNKVVKESCYLLSLKDLNTISHVKELMDYGIASFKIEGRMKKKEYVGYITSLYRKAIDHKDYKINEEELKKAKKIFNRGYTEGFLYGEKGSNLFNPYRPNHLGVRVGKVIALKKNRIVVKLSDTIHQNDGIRVLMDKEDIGFMINKMYLNNLLVKEAFCGDVVELECRGSFVKGSEVVKTTDSVLEKELDIHDRILRKVGVKVAVWAASGKELCMMFCDDRHQIRVYGPVLEKALKRPVTDEDIKAQISKTNNTIFTIKELDIYMDEELFIPLKSISELRRQGLDMLYHKRASFMEREKVSLLCNDVVLKKHDFCIDAKVLREDQLLVCLKEGIQNIYVEDEELYEKYANYSQVKKISSRVMKTNYDKVNMIQDIGGIDALDEFVCDTSLNVYNAMSCYFLHSQGASLVTLSHELTKQEVKTLIQSYYVRYHHMPNVACVVYGRVEVMVSEHCPINASLLDNNKENCTLCRKRTYGLKDKFGNIYPMNNDSSCRMRLYDYKIHDYIGDILDYKRMGVSVRLDFTFEDENQTKEVIVRTKQEAME